MVKKEEKRSLKSYLILNKYICSLFGLNNIDDFRKLLNSNVSEGINQNKRFYYTDVLLSLNISDDFRQKLNQYDENIQEYLNQINKTRYPPIVLKYFQYLAILFTEIYLDNYYNNFDSFYNDYLKFIIKKESQDKVVYPKPNRKYMNKLCFWSATGSGKTIIMHINFLQIQKYNQKFDNFLLITPNEGLTLQHLKDLKLSNIESKIFEAQRTLDDWVLKNPLKVIDIHKIKNEVSSQDGKTIPVEAFGENNVVFVDEGHKGSSSEEKTWVNLRKRLVSKNGFTFEYSATFGEITSDDNTFSEYASTIIFDYRYKYFYEDGFGKDYNILNLKNKSDYSDEYFTGSILSLYEQKLYFNNYKRQLSQFNLENPLMIFVGSSVSGKNNNSDVLKVIDFLSKFVNNSSDFKKHIINILTGKSTLEDDKGRLIFNNKFGYLRELINSDKEFLNKIYDNILEELLFHKKSSKTLQVIDIKDADGEIGLKFDSEYFGVINIGDTSSFLKLVEEQKSQYVKVGLKDNFSKSLFKKIESSDSKINFLLGSKKFIEGWNSFRVSSMGLLNIGKKEGSQIIQLFGRGVRLRGYNGLLKRSYQLNNEGLVPVQINIPDKINLLETLNIFGLDANYMSKFREDLKEEGIGEYETIKLKVKPSLPDVSLYVPRIPKDKLDFNSSEYVLNYNQKISNIKIDLSPKIDILKSTIESNQIDSDSSIKENIIEKNVIELLNFQEIFIDLLKYKDLKKYDNIYFTKNDLKEILINSEKYKIICKKEMLELNSFENVTKLRKIQDYSVQLLKLYVDKIYNYKKYSWYQKNLNYEVVSEEDENLIPKEYVVTINLDEKSAIKNVTDLINHFKSFIRINSEDTEDIYSKNISFNYNLDKILDFFAINIHLFQPLIYKNKELDFIKISPTNIVKSERDFITYLTEYLEEHKEALGFDQVYLLRNPSKKGVGFFETKYFYPDFILWTIKGNEQTINFIEPHGLGRESIDNEKFSLYKKIKEIEKLLTRKTYPIIKLNVIILSDTKHSKLNWNISKEDLKDKNVLFLEDGKKCLKDVFEIIYN
ncbi:MAG: DEAD/DEAH box helicase family protein [Peptostreptococcales bacterium]